MLANFGLVETNAKAIKIGQKFGRLSVIEVGQIPNSYRYIAVCVCECGALIKQRFDHLLKGFAVSCGCFRVEKITKHGLKNSPHYNAWKNMLDRCYNEKCKAYKNYGGRGIKVHQPWHDIRNFVADLPSGYKPGVQLDRIDNDGDYEPGNIRWATPKQNSANRRSTTKLTFKGETKSQREWARQLGIDERLINSRILNLGWSVDRALSEPVLEQLDVVKRASATRWAGHETQGRPGPKTSRRLLRVNYAGREMTMAELSDHCGIGTKDLRRRIFELGWPVDRAIKT